MKTFEDFLLEGVGDKVGNMSDDQFDQFMKGRTPEESKTYREARAKARGEKDKKNRAIVVRKKEEGNNKKGKTAGLGAKPRSANAKEVPPKSKQTIHRYMPKVVTPKKDENKPVVSSDKRGEEEKREKRERQRGKGINLELGKKAGWLKDRLGDTAKALSQETNKDVQTYEAKPIA